MASYGPHPGSKTSYPNTTKTMSSTRSTAARSTRHETLYPGPFELRDDHLRGSVEARMENDYAKRRSPSSMRAWPLMRGRGFANTFNR